MRRRREGSERETLRGSHTYQHFIQQFIHQDKVEPNGLLIQNTAVVLTKTRNSIEIKVQRAKVNCNTDIKF